MTSDHRLNIMGRKPTLVRLGSAWPLGRWAFLLLRLGSFHPTDWPSHAVHPYPPIANLCGAVGAFIAYYMFLIVGQGAFPILFFTGVIMVLFVAHNRVSDPWMRLIGLLLFVDRLPKRGRASSSSRESTTDSRRRTGGILGIGPHLPFLQSHFSGVGNAAGPLIGMLVGSLLAADDLVLRARRAVGDAMHMSKIRRGGRASGVQSAFAAETAFAKWICDAGRGDARPPSTGGSEGPKAVQEYDEAGGGRGGPQGVGPSDGCGSRAGRRRSGKRSICRIRTMSRLPGGAEAA